MSNRDLAKMFALHLIRELRPFVIAGLVLLALIVLPKLLHAQALPIVRVLQAAATTVGPGTTLQTSGYRNKTLAVEISGTGTIRVECSVDNGTTYDIIEDTTLNQATDPPCAAPPNRCLLDIPVSCTHMRAPILACSGCTITAKMFAED